MVFRFFFLSLLQESPLYLLLKRFTSHNQSLSNTLHAKLTQFKHRNLTKTNCTLKHTHIQHAQNVITVFCKPKMQSSHFNARSQCLKLEITTVLPLNHKQTSTDPLLHELYLWQLPLAGYYTPTTGYKFQPHLEHKPAQALRKLTNKSTFGVSTVLTMSHSVLWVWFS